MSSLKKLILSLIFVLLLVPSVQAQTLSQIGFVVKKALPEVENIAVLCVTVQKDIVSNEAKTAFLVTRKKFHVYVVRGITDIPKALANVRELKNCALVIITDDSTLNQKSVKYVSQKLALKKIPVISNRTGDTKQGALLVVTSQDNSVKTYASKVVAGALAITLSDEFLASTVIDGQ